jgi:hypothetical protein
MYDLESVSLWIHTTGKAVIGKHKDKTLKFLPSTVTTWKSWKKDYPDTLVLNIQKGKDPRFDMRKSPKSGGLSVGEPDGELKLYPLEILQGKRVVNDKLAGKNVTVVFDPEAFTFAAFERGDRTFSWKDGKMLDEKGTEWNPLTGTSGEMSMKRVPVVLWLTTAWKRFYPEGAIYSEK